MSHESGLSRVSSKETTNQKAGRSGSKNPIKKGPAVGHTSGNPTKGGGITQGTRGKFKG
jgi:hypothetical protein